MSNRVLADGAPGETAMSKFLSGIAVMVLMLASAGTASAQSVPDFSADKVVNAEGGDVRTASASVVINGQAASIRAAGASVAIHADVAGSADVAGAEVTVDGSVGQARLAGGSVTLTGDVAGDAYIAGGVLAITSRIGGQLFAAGGQVTIGPQSVIVGSAKVGGGKVTFDGRAENGARLSGGSVTLNGTVSGDLTLEGGQIVIGATAVVTGNVLIRSVNEPTIVEGSQISGTVTRETPASWWDEMAVGSWAFRLGAAFFIATATVITGIVTMILGRGTFEDAVTLTRSRFVSSFLVGLVTLILLPIVAIALMVTVAGIPAGLALLFAVPILVFVSYAVTAAGLADLIFNRPQSPRIAGRTVVFLIVGAVILGLISLIPVAGPIIVFILLLVGIGAFLRSARRRAKRGRRAPPVQTGKSPVAA
jgi:hypothetical protein